MTDVETQIEFKSLEEENNRLTTQINSIMEANHFSPLQKDELWTAIQQLIDNEIEQEDYCNQ